MIIRHGGLALGALLLAASRFALASPSAAAELELRNAGEEVALESTQSGDLAGRLDSFFRSCHTYSDVVSGQVLPQAELVALWQQQANLPHAVLHVTYAPDAPEPLGGKTVDVLFGFTAESGPNPVLARSPDGAVTCYIKCPGLEGLLLACQVHALIPGMKPSSRCAEWRALDAELSRDAAKPPR